MENLEWSNEMSVGSEEIDRQHQVLFSLYNNLLVVLSNPVANKVFGLSDGVLEGLVDYVKIHFAYEEDLIARAGYPDVSEHKAQHEIYVRTILEAQDRLGQGMGEDGWDSLCKFLSEWLVGHVMGTDRLYIPYIRALAD